MKKTIALKLKILFTLILTFSLLFTGGCSKKDLLNDPVTGEIIPPVTPSTLNDGIFSAATDYYDARGFRQKLSIDVINGIITKVDFEEIDKNNLIREETQVSEKDWPQSENLSLGKIRQNLIEGFIKKQNPNDIDSVSGATETSEDFKALSQGAYSQSSLNTNETIIIPTNETYTIKGTPDSEGFQGVLTASFSGSILINLTYDEIRIEDGRHKSKMTENETPVNFKALFSDFTAQTLGNQNLSPGFQDLDFPPEKQRYLEVLNMLNDFRTVK